MYAFLLTLIVACCWNFVAKDPVSSLFTTSALLHRAFEAAFVGLLFPFLMDEIHG